MEKIIDKIKFPETWKPCKISKLGKVFKGKGISKAEILDSGLACIRYGEIYSKYGYKVDGTHSFINKDSASKSQEIKYGDILFTGSGETAEEIGKAVAYIGREQAYAGGDIIILRPNEPDSGLFYGYLMNSDYVVQQKFQEAQGQSVVHLYGKSMDRIKVILPPLPEQQKIATILSKWDELIETQTQLIEEKEKQKKGLMQKLLTGEVRFPGFEEGWEVYKIKDLFNLIAGKDLLPKHYSTTRTETHKYPLYSNSLTNNGLYGYYDISQISKNKITVTARGTIGIAKARKKPFNAMGRLLVLDPKKELNIDYCTEYINEQIEVFIESTGVPQLTAPAFSNYQIIIPSFKEQSRIASLLLAIDEEIQSLKDKLEAIKLQKKGLMQQLLTGKIRVKI